MPLRPGKPVAGDRQHGRDGEPWLPSAGRCPAKGEAFAAARTGFPTCQFDESACDLGVKRPRHYRKEWDDERGVWKDRPRHDDSSHGADAFITFACSGYEPPEHYTRIERDLSWVV